MTVQNTVAKFFSKTIKSRTMTTTSLTMNRHSIASLFLAAVMSMMIFSSCKKDNDRNDNKLSKHSSQVLDKWLTLQIRLMKNTAGVPNHAFSRHYAYAGVAALQSLAPGLPPGMLSKIKWNGLTNLPQAKGAGHYYFPANLNAALATINRAMFPTAKEEDKQAIDSLENALTQEFLATQSSSLVQTSAAYGKAVALAVFNWAETDGHWNANNPYTPPAGPGMWVPTAPAFANPATPHWGNNRPVITNSIANTQLPTPPAYSADPIFDFYQMVKKVYDVSQTLTDDQKAMAMFWRDVPGVTSPGHWVSILQQAIRQQNSSLDKAAFAYALTGAALNDALITCFKAKYQYTLVRPITYIRNVMGHSTWNPYLGTPAHPEYSSAHAALSTAVAEVMERLFGDIDSFTDHTYDYLGFAPRTYTSFRAIGNEASQSRLYAGIHYQPSIDAGIQQGKKVAANILNNLPGNHNNIKN